MDLKCPTDAGHTTGRGGRHATTAPPRVLAPSCHPCARPGVLLHLSFLLSTLLFLVGVALVEDVSDLCNELGVLIEQSSGYGEVVPLHVVKQVEEPDRQRRSGYRLPCYEEIDLVTKRRPPSRTSRSHPCAARRAARSPRRSARRSCRPASTGSPCGSRPRASR